MKINARLRRWLLRFAGFDAAEAESASELIAALELKSYEEGTLSPTKGERHADWTWRIG